MESCPHNGETWGSSGSGGVRRASLDTRALAEASRNLTQTLRQLSSEVLTARPQDPDVSPPPPCVGFFLFLFTVTEGLLKKEEREGGEGQNPWRIGP